MPPGGDVVRAAVGAEELPAGRPGQSAASWTGVARPSEMTTARPGGGLCSGSNRTPNGSLSMSPRGHIRTARPWPRAMAARSTRCPKPGPNPAVRITLQPRLFRDARALLASGESRSASSASAIAVRSKVPASALAWSPDQYWPECGSRPRREPGASRVHPRQRSQQRAFSRTGAAEDREDAAGAATESRAAAVRRRRPRGPKQPPGPGHPPGRAWRRARQQARGILCPGPGCRTGPAPRPRSPTRAARPPGRASSRRPRSWDAARPRPLVRTAGPHARSPEAWEQRRRTRPRGRGPAPAPEAAATQGGLRR